MGVLNPALQIMVYWLVFGLGIRSNAPIHGIPFVFWLLVGISMWFFINQGLRRMKFNQVAKMNFPLSIIPTYIVTSRFYGHLGLLAIIIIACMFNGIIPSIHIVQLLICTFCIFANIVGGTFNIHFGILIRDTQMIMQALMKNIVLYVSNFMGAKIMA